MEEFNPRVRCAFGNFCIGYWAGRGSGAATNDLGKYLILEYIFLTFFVHISAVTTAIIFIHEEHTYISLVKLLFDHSNNPRQTYLRHSTILIGVLFWWNTLSNDTEGK